MVPAPQAALSVAEIVAECRPSRQIVAVIGQKRQIVAESCCAVVSEGMRLGTSFSRCQHVALDRAKDVRRTRRTGEGRVIS